MRIVRAAETVRKAVWNKHVAKTGPLTRTAAIGLAAGFRGHEAFQAFDADDGWILISGTSDERATLKVAFTLLREHGIDLRETGLAAAVRIAEHVEALLIAVHTLDTEPSEDDWNAAPAYAC